MTHLRERLTFSNVVACLALFIALGGAAYAGTHPPKNSVGPKQLKKNAVITQKLKDEAVTTTKIKDGAVNGAKVAPNSLTGAQVNVNSLGKVPAAQTADTARVADALAPIEPLHKVGAPGEAQVQNGCQLGEEVAPVGFFKDHDGVVHLQGLYFACSTLGAIAFQLPAGFRPGGLQQFPLASSEAAVIVLPKELADSQSGGVKCGASACYLNGITFRAES